MTRKSRITQKITDQLQPNFLQVENNSYLHKGHLGDDGTMETHFSITIKADILKDLSRIAAHQKINRILQDEFLSGLHALEIKILV